MKNTLVRKNFDYYLAHQAEIVEGHLGEWVVLKDKAVVGYFVKEEDAFEAMTDSKLGTFIVHNCQEPGTDIIHYYGNRVRFA